MYTFILYFLDLLGENAGGPGSALGFQYYGGPVVTVLASKTSREYTVSTTFTLSAVKNLISPTSKFCK